MKPSRLKALRIQFGIIDFLSNFRCFHRIVLNKKIYLGAAIISINLLSSSCTSKPNKNKNTLPEKPSKENFDEQISCYDTIAPAPASNKKNDSEGSIHKKEKQ
jgi:hypothetical protein